MATITVRSNDTLSGIAARNGLSVDALLRANPQLRNPDLIHPGMRLNLPGSRDEFTAPPRPLTPLNGVRPVPANPFHQEFVRATSIAGVPPHWATNPAMLELVHRESRFRVDADNPTSTAFGLFQMIKSTWKAYCPEVPYGSRDACWQAVGGFRYIEDRYSTPERALGFWMATVNKNPAHAPADLRDDARDWIRRGWGGY